MHCKSSTNDMSVPDSSLTTNKEFLKSQTNSSSAISEVSETTKTTNISEKCTSCSSCLCEKRKDECIEQLCFKWQCTNFNKKQQTLSTFLEDGSEEYFKPFLLPEKVLSRFALVLGKYNYF